FRALQCPNAHSTGTQALVNNSCDRDDHICRCKNTSKVAAIIEPCISGQPWTCWALFDGSNQAICCHDQRLLHFLESDGQ
ncbi:hypothetical protein DHEL01_v209698, partial [Diaporthe helianthi]